MATSKPKGILKASSFESSAERERKSKEMKWDEMNILATHHPPGKDYGHMKIDEPPTPYSKCSDPEDDDDDELTRRNSVGKMDDLDPESVASRLKHVDNKGAVFPDEDESSDEDLDETPEERAKRKVFEQKRKLHYNEFQAVKLAKQLMEEEDDDDEADDENDDDNLNTKDKVNVVQSQKSDSKSIPNEGTEIN